jgi:uncharacterized protein YdhG (YjbR/CyaY superfamily)
MAATAFQSVDDYLRSQPPLLARVRTAIRKAVPAAQESISYNIPTYKLNDRPILYFGGWKRHYSLYPASPQLVAAFREELSGYEVQKGTIRFPLSQPVPVKLIANIAKFRAKEAAAPTRRALMMLAAGSLLSGRRARAAQPISLFDGKTLDGWIQIENSATSLPSGDIADPAALAARLAAGKDPVSTFLRDHLQDSVKADLAAFAPANDNAKAVVSAMAKDLNHVIAGPSIYDAARFRGIVLRPETRRLLDQNPRGVELARLNRLLLEDAYPAEVAKGRGPGWVVKDGAMASTGTGRGVIYSAKDYRRFRLSFSMRHVSGNPDHQACVLIFCTRPQAGEKPLDALAGIQFQVPNGGHWDYRPGMNNNGGAEFTSVTKGAFDVHQWSRVEILADASTGTARMWVAQPPGARPVEVLAFHDPAAGKAGPIAWQMHNAGLFDEFKDVSIELDPQEG